jgi:hypothetical protein
MPTPKLSPIVIAYFNILKLLRDLMQSSTQITDTKPMRRVIIVFFDKSAKHI